MTAKLLVPLSFEPSSTYYENYLAYLPMDGATKVTWPLLNISLIQSGDYNDFEDLSKQNGKKFKSYSRNGFSVGHYHEFLLAIDPEHTAAFRFAEVESTFGKATPFAAFVFNGYHREKYFGDWDYIMSLRMVNVEMEEVEAAFVNSCIKFEARYGYVPELFEIDESKIFFDTDITKDDTNLQVGPPIFTNLEPLRFFFGGISQNDAASSCIYFYKVLEYFAFYVNVSDVRSLRHDMSVSDIEFSKKILDVVFRDEKGPLFRLISNIVDDHFLMRAHAEGLIDNKAIRNLQENLYAFRNSIVHGKFSYGYSLNSVPILEQDAIVTKWRPLLKDLALRAIERYGSRRA